MATYEHGETEDFKIESVEDIEAVLKVNNIIPTYKEHLKQVNTCVLMFEELEAGRSYGTMFSDWVVGTRSEVINLALIQSLRELKEELLTGIRYYTRLLVQKDELKKVLEYIPISKSKLYVRHKNVQQVSVFANYAGLAASIGAFILAPSTCVAVGVAVISAIYEIAKNQGKEKALKYQQIIDLKDALGYEYLSNIRTNHEVLGKMYETIDKKFKSKEIKKEILKDVYSNVKERSLKELKEVGMDDRVCKIMSEREAKKECESFLINIFESSEKEAEELINAITMT